MVPKPITIGKGNKVGLIAYGTSDLCMAEALDQLSAEGVKPDYMRIRAVPFTAEVKQFIEDHERVYVIDQNRDGQMFNLLNLHLKEGRLIDKLKSIRHYDGTPLDARTVCNEVTGKEKAL